MGAAWFVVHTQPNAEAKAKRHLAHQGFTVYLPFYRRRVRHARRNEIVASALFPGYLFVRFDPEQDRWRSINGTRGVVRILGDDAAPRSLADSIIEEIKSREDETGAVRLNPPAFARGQAVQLAAGALADVSALFEQKRDQDRVVILLSMLGRKVRVLAPAGEVIAAA